MGSRGDCFDNATAESFFATLECELLARRRFPTRSAARLALFDYIEGFYNTHRRHSALGYLSPAAYERRCARNRSSPTSYLSTKPGQLQNVPSDRSPDARSASTYARAKPNQPHRGLLCKRNPGPYTA
jgi:hypothetical protein